ncbi:hypothetical protein [Pseudogemmobacter bohemicus]|nr:hypothetical protein [Pseudogemmobacter bohemicus]
MSALVAPPVRIGIAQDFVDSVLQTALALLRPEASRRMFALVIGSSAGL